MGEPGVRQGSELTAPLISLQALNRGKGLCQEATSCGLLNNLGPSPLQLLLNPPAPRRCGWQAG